VGYLTPFRWRRNLDIRLEHRICARADMVLANTSSNRRSMLAKHHLDPERITTITNGYDEACFQGLRPRPDPSRFRIAYSGSFYEPSSVQVFLAAFGKFLAGIEHPRLTLQLAGESCDWPRRYIQDAAVLPHLEFLGYIRHRDVCTMLVNSDLLLAVCPAGTPYWVPGKLYEYLRAGRPIVAVCDRPSEVAAMVEQTGRGRAFRHCEMDDLIAYFRQCYEQWQTGTPTPRFEADESIRAYDRRVLTERLAAILDRLVEESHNGRAAAAPARR
jgi:glycosyltransferase involved in cell wall biosynthesis